MYKISDEHSNRLPFVRISKVELFNIKGVQHGCVEFNCFKEDIPYNTKADILGLYGQNGSGKSSLVDALNVLKGIIGGYKIGPSFNKIIDVATESARIVVEFEFQYESGTKASVEYSVVLNRMANEQIELNADDTEDTSPYIIGISNEIIKTTLYDDGSVGRVHTIVDTENNLFCGKTLRKYYFDNTNEEITGELQFLKRKVYDESKSFVFCKEMASLMWEHGPRSKYYEILAEIDLYASVFLFVIGTKTSGLVQLRAGLPIFFPEVDRPILLVDKKPMPLPMFQKVKNEFEKINKVIETLIPDLQLRLVDTPTKLKNGEDAVYIKVYSVRGTREFPFEYESDGIIKIVMILADYIFAFNQGSATLVVDEFDSGIFEFLLGELLEIFESSGKGQFIFTSHNLRPLEVIDKKFIRFTTADPNNRYYKLKSVGNTNNLRDMYLREVQLGKQDVEMYKRTKSFKIVKALKKLGEVSINE